MSFVKAISGNNRLLIYFMFLIILPGIILSVLAFRGIQNDQAIIEREKRRTLEKEGEFLVSYIREYLDNSNEILISSLDQSNGISDSIYLNVLKLDGSKRSWISLTPDQDIDQMASQAPLFTEGLQLEFQTKDFFKALRFYEKKLEITQNPNTKLHLYKVIARLLQKAGKIENAIAVHRTILNLYDDIPIFRSIPAGRIAMNEIIQSYIDLGEREKAILSLDSLYQDILSHRWNMDWKDYLFIQSRTMDIASSLHVDEDKIPEMTKSPSSHWSTVGLMDTLAMSLNEFRNNVFPGIDLNNEDRKYKEHHKFNYYYEILRKKDLRYIALYDLAYVEKIIRNYLESRLDLFGYSIINKETITSLDAELSKNQSINVMFPSDLPPWSFELVAQPSEEWFGMKVPSSSIFIYIFSFIVLLIAFGFYFVIKSINSELRLSQLKSDFIATVSHEFKSPLTAIRQLSERLEENKVTSEQRKQDYYKALHTQSIRLSRLVDNILDFAKLESGDKVFTFQDSDVNGLITDIGDRFQKGIVQSTFPISFELDPNLPIVLLDVNSMAQVFENLLDNALKYAPSEKGVIFYTSHDHSYVSIILQDFGPGIPKEEQVKIFDRFYSII